MVDSHFGWASNEQEQRKNKMAKQKKLSRKQKIKQKKVQIAAEVKAVTEPITAQTTLSSSITTDTANAWSVYQSAESVLKATKAQVNAAEIANEGITLEYDSGNTRTTLRLSSPEACF